MNISALTEQQQNAKFHIFVVPEATDVYVTCFFMTSRTHFSKKNINLYDALHGYMYSDVKQIVKVKKI